MRYSPGRRWLSSVSKFSGASLLSKEAPLLETFRSCSLRVLPLFALIPLIATSAAKAQSAAFDTTSISAPLLFTAAPGGSVSRSGEPSTAPTVKPFSRISFGVGISSLGIGLQAATNVNRHLNLRATGNIFNYTDSGIHTQGFAVTAKANFTSAGASVDYYPFHAGFRLSPGILFTNQNKVDVNFLAASGTSFTLSNHTYYSASGSNAVQGVGNFGLGNGSPAFTLTTGWGNAIPASGRHISFPFEIGVAFIKTPTAALTLSGLVCDAQGQNCVDVATDTTAQGDLTAQIKSYANDINQLKTYPVVSFGVAYNFTIRPY